MIDWLEKNLLIVGAVILVVIALGVGGWLADPFGWKKSALDNAKVDAEVSADAAASSALTAEGAQESLQRVEVTVRHVNAATALSDDFSATARQSPDAQTPLSNDRAARLRDADDGLCQLSPSLAGC